MRQLGNTDKKNKDCGGLIISLKEYVKTVFSKNTPCLLNQRDNDKRDKEFSNLKEGFVFFTLDSKEQKQRKRGGLMTQFERVLCCEQLKFHTISTKQNRVYIKGFQLSLKKVFLCYENSRIGTISRRKSRVFQRSQIGLKRHLDIGFKEHFVF